LDVLPNFDKLFVKFESNWVILLSYFDLFDVCLIGEGRIIVESIAQFGGCQFVYLVG